MTTPIPVPEFNLTSQWGAAPSGSSGVPVGASYGSAIPGTSTTGMYPVRDANYVQPYLSQPTIAVKDASTVQGSPSGTFGVLASDRNKINQQTVDKGSGPGYSGNTVNQTVGAPGGGSYRWDGSQWVYQAPSGDNGVSASDISDAYAPAIAALQGYIDAANTGATEDTTNLNTRVANQSGQLDVQQGELLGDTAIEQNKFNDSLRSALEDAIRAYNALAQQGNARFGRGNSAGGAVGELASQEFFRQQGAVGKQQTSGDLQFEGERTKIKNFVAKGKQDLDMYKNEAITEIQKGLRETLADIESRKGDIETNKTRDRIAALQNAKETAQRVSEANTTFRQNLITTAISNMQSVLGRVLTPAEIKVQVQELNNIFADSQGNLITMATPASRALRNVNAKSEDELDNAGLMINSNVPELNPNTA
ncbi:hypothetical protein M0R04_15100 [Candidatus Dojkabacteria bacterium]|jgi:hypothetical protein|nr:hypothetical protein [Candidatus Dojkabacteria bacterium]